MASMSFEYVIECWELHISNHKHLAIAIFIDRLLLRIFKT